MKGCLGEKALVALLAGRESARDRGHLEACASCGARYRALERDLAGMAAVLRCGPPGAASRPGVPLPGRIGATERVTSRGDTPPAGSRRVPASRSRRRAAAARSWLEGEPSRPWPWVEAAAATLALAVALALSLRWGSPPDTAADEAEISAAATEISTALFQVDETQLLELQDRTPAYLYASAALAGGWPCNDGGGDPSWSCEAY